MQNKSCRPYSDDYLFYDEISKHYVLTEKALMENVGINLRARLSTNSTVNPETVIRSFTKRVSDMIYMFIHKHNVNNARQDCLISTIPQLRQIVQRAMEIQAVYVLTVGDLFLSTKFEDRDRAIDELAQETLNTDVYCIGGSILYSGVI